jgi:hypothetical protein
MSIETVFAKRDALLGAIDKGLGFAAPKASDLKRPIELQQTHVDALKIRIEALEGLRKQQNDRIDSDIAALKAELKAAGDKLDADREVLSSITDRSPDNPSDKPHPTPAAVGRSARTTTKKPQS